jgi:hypothetical protein
VKILVVVLARPHIPRIYAILGERASALRVLSEQKVTVIVKIPDNGDRDAALAEALDYVRDGIRRLASVDRYTNELAPCASQLLYLRRCSLDVYRIRVCHRLNNYGVWAAHSHAAYIDRYRPPSISIRHSNAPLML